MTKKSDMIYVEHILDSIEAIEDFSKNITKEILSTDRLKKSAIVRELEIIGEAVKNISDGKKKEYSSIPWKEIAGTRDKIIHHYFGIDLNIIWNIIKNELPKLRKDIMKIKNDLLDKNGI
ncbi:MAG: DUF86 domain-containing protein [Candidatus Pacearchaeota archaeon]